MRVLFIHGLEGHPTGTKVVQLRAQGFDVHAADMEMSVWNMRKPNAVVRNLLRLPELRLAVGASLLGLAAAARRRSLLGATAAVAAGGIWATQRRRALTRTAVTRSFERCVRVQRQAIASVRPDVVVGSSWGGAVAAELLHDGAWNGPTVFLAPAIARVGERLGRAPSLRDDRGARLRARAVEIPMVIFHDPTDTVVPYADSERLAADSAIDMRSVDAGGHRLLGLLERGELAACLRDLPYKP
jgi:hypothetical protein